MYDNSKSGTKQTQAHDGTERWSYFTNAINYVDEAQPNRNGTYDFNLDVMRREDGDYAYTFYLKKRRTDAPGLSLPGSAAKMPPTQVLLKTVYPKREKLSRGKCPRRTGGIGI